MSNAALTSALKTLHAGGVIAYPTEAVWGLGCDPHNEAALHKILALKARPVSKGVILVSGQIEHFQSLLSALDQDIVARMRASWPGHNTWLVPHHNAIPAWISGDSDKVAVRVSTHPLIAAVTRAFGGAIVSTSANPAGLPEARNESEVRAYFSSSELHYCSGETGGENRPSTIIDALTAKVLRA